MRPFSLLIGAFQASQLNVLISSDGSTSKFSPTGGGTLKENGWIGRISSSVVFAVGHTSPGQLATFAVNNNSLTRISTVNNTQGSSPAHAAVVGKLLVAANYVKSDGSLSSRPLFVDVLTFDRKQKRPNAARQGQAHPHFVLAHPSGQYAIICDLGLDQIHILKVTGGTKLSVVRSVNTTPGDGPRHAAFTSDGKTLYVVNELSNSVSAYTWANGNLKLITSVSMLPDGANATQNAAAEIVLSPDSQFVYATLRNTSSSAPSDFGSGQIAGDTIAIYSADNGRPKLIKRVLSQGIGPRGFVLSPSGARAVATNQYTASATVCDRDSRTGDLINPQNFAVPSSIQPVSALWLSE